MVPGASRRTPTIHLIAVTTGKVVPVPGTNRARLFLVALSHVNLHREKGRTITFGRESPCRSKLLVSSEPLVPKE